MEKTVKHINACDSKFLTQVGNLNCLRTGKLKTSETSFTKEEEEHTEIPFKKNFHTLTTTTTTILQRLYGLINFTFLYGIV